MLLCFRRNCNNRITKCCFNVLANLAVVVRSVLVAGVVVAASQLEAGVLVEVAFVVAWVPVAVVAPVRLDIHTEAVKWVEFV